MADPITGMDEMTSPFDLEELLERVGGDRDLLAELVQIYEEEAGMMLAEIRRSSSVSDAAGLERAAHRLRGSVGSLGARAAAEAALALETMGRERRMTDVPDQIAHLDRELDRLAKALTPLAGEHTS